MMGEKAKRIAGLEAQVESDRLLMEDASRSVKEANEALEILRCENERLHDCLGRAERAIAALKFGFCPDCSHIERHTAALGCPRCSCKWGMQKPPIALLIPYVPHIA